MGEWWPQKHFGVATNWGPGKQTPDTETPLAWLQTPGRLLPSLGVRLGHSIDVQIGRQQHARVGIWCPAILRDSSTLKGTPG